MFTQAEIQPFLDDYKAVTGNTSDKFICPLTLEACELDEISAGHIVNKVIPYAFNRTVPVKTKPDNFYGTRVEASFIRYVTLSDITPVDLLQSQSKFQVRFHEGGRMFDAFHIRNEKEVEEKKRHLPVVRLSRDGVPFFIGLKNVAKGHPDVPLDDVSGSAEISFSERFLPAHWVASMLKIAHLTMFNMMGYRAIYDPSADALRRVLCQYFYKNASREEAPDYFRPFANSTKVIGIGKDFSKDSYTPVDFDTIRDHKILCHFHANRHFAATLVYKLPSKTISVTIPQTTDTVDIAVATRLYDRLLDDDDDLKDRVILTHFDGTRWVGEREINTHYQPPVESMVIDR